MKIFNFKPKKSNETKQKEFAEKIILRHCCYGHDCCKCKLRYKYKGIYKKKKMDLLNLSYFLGDYFTLATKCERIFFYILYKKYGFTDFLYEFAKFSAHNFKLFCEGNAHLNFVKKYKRKIKKESIE